MKRLFWRIYLVVLLALALFGGIAWWLVQRNIDERKQALQQAEVTQLQFLAEQAEQVLPFDSADQQELEQAFRRFARPFRRPMALTDAQDALVAMWRPKRGPPRARGQRLERRRMAQNIKWVDGEGKIHVQLRSGHRLWVFHPPKPPVGQQNLLTRLGQRVTGLTAVGSALFLLLLGVMSAVFVFPLVFQLSRRMDALKRSMAAFGAGQLAHRSSLQGNDELAELSHKFNDMAARIEGLVQEHKTLLATTSHELRSPLTRLRMAVDLLLHTDGDAEKAEVRAEVERNIAELDALIGDVLLSSQLNAHDAPLGASVFDVVDVLNQEMSYYPEATLTASSMPTDTPIWVDGERTLVMRAFRNVLENARRYGGAQGVDAADADTPSTIEVTVQSVGHDVLEVSFADRGAGVPEALREQIFQPFFRLPEHKESQGGTGVGLMLVKQIADRHEGVRYEARAGGGSCFVLRFRLAAKPVS